VLSVLPFVPAQPNLAGLTEDHWEKQWLGVDVWRVTFCAQHSRGEDRTEQDHNAHQVRGYMSLN
jgi:hypothetical protein